MKLMIVFLTVVLSIVGSGSEIELKGWESTTPGASLMPGCGINGGTALGVQGELGKNSRYYTWKSDPVNFESNAVYGFEFFLNREVSGSEVHCNTVFHNLVLNSDLHGWKKIRTIMRAPFGGMTSHVSLSDYNCQGRTLFDSMRLVRLEPRYRTESGITLGRGEVICGNHYYFVPQRKCAAAADTRVFSGYKSASTGSTFVFWRGGEAIYRFNVAGRRFLNAHCMLHLSDIIDTALHVDASTDGRNWMNLVVATNAVPTEFVFPKSLFPANEVFLRMKRSSDKSPKAWCRAFEIHFDGEIDGEPVYLAGATTYLEKGTDAVFESVDTQKFRVAKPGSLLPGATGDIAVWGVSSGYKIFRDTMVPKGKASALRVSAAANEAESVQLVITPKIDISNLRIEAGTLKKKGAAAEVAEIPASAAEVLRVGYVDVKIATDKVGQSGLFPDPLLPQDKAPLAVKAGENQPMWITVKVPKGTPKGVYCGELTVIADGRRIVVPFEVEVFGFEMPDRMTLRTAFGISPSTLYRYHKPKTPEDRLRIREMYIKVLAEHHVTPFYWGKLFAPKVKLNNADKPETLSVDVDFSEFDLEMGMIIDKYHGNTVKVTPDGLGGGNQYRHKEPQICGVKRGDPRYERIMQEYLKKYVQHLREKGWLEYAYVFWFDEPYGRDYEFVSQGMATVRKYAPELPRMITCGFNEKMLDEVNLWCPLVQNLHLPLEGVCRERGDGIWWYICSSPRSAPVGEHIEHPGTDMRVWSWQNWGENVTGSLVWTVNWWTSSGGYPDPENPQDPYLDTMSWGKKFNPKRIAAIWCSGDGRYIYPPLACKDAKQPQTVFDDPVSCYRLALFRDGVEDYEYFTILKRLDLSNPLLRVPKSVYRDLWTYAHEPEAMETHREKLAREIESKKDRK
ncbi:MAG: DUF4091 domain-containing protein [Kiritimatiellae bacterium]|nr:DUF4091 domain-containing protein [Kiritimatiellia bacterium]